MSESTSSGESIHGMQTFLDNQWWMVFLCQVVPGVIYLAWGLYDVFNIPPGLN